MNPSAAGWINRYLVEYDRDLQELSEYSFEAFYHELKKVGFIYGTNLTPVSQRKNDDFKLTQEELAKVNLFTALSIVYFHHNSKKSHELCLKTIISFYAKLKRTHQSLFQFKWLSKSKPDKELENILHQRVQTNDSYLQKNFSNIVTNALLFIDVIAFKNFLNNTYETCWFATRTEELLVNTLYLALKEKKLKGKYDEIIIKLIQSSLRYHEIEIDNLKRLSDLDFSILKDKVEKLYLIDMMCMTLYSDEVIDETEKDFIIKLSHSLNISRQDLDHSIQFLYDFVNKNKSEIYYFNTAHPVKYFYDRTYRTLSLLIVRNKKRIIKEISQSKELMHLLMISSYRDLNSIEKRKVKTQLLDIFKTIPSLAIFALPGGSLLLPIVIKMIPSILPSSFNENLNKES
ncbi:LETM1-related biofilm-associated protein [Mesohalobacter halotolerans]|uniref:Letm1 RBD domain-containing protein n=1 Tax=Mesohalobacter halotolerans TaxID=1883405 RepID=A0A4U5TNJ6_9FLAO|nr:LETM1-related biofilm-associated protein [Mesohalobacter halotolerans]MBS3738417.1 hypothetical protein [Psychroflexus sp.]TKS55589.1 hypothetical protein FCN74_11620 [Mesohalobacter halotolerans]